MARIPFNCSAGVVQVTMGMYVLFVSLKQQQKTPKAMQGRLYSRKDLDHEWPECLCLFYAKNDISAPQEVFQFSS